MTARSAAAALGEDVLATLVSHAEDAVCVVDTDGLVRYANPAAGRLLRQAPAEVRARSLVAAFPPGEQAWIRTRLRTPEADAAMSFTSKVYDAHGVGHDVVCSTSALDVGGTTGTAVVLRDVTGPLAAARRAVALAQAAAQLVGSASVHEILSGIARHAFEGSQAVAAAVIMMGDGHRLHSGGAYDGDGPDPGRESASWAALNLGQGEDVLRSLSAGKIIVGERPGNPVVLPDAREAWLADPLVRPFALTLDWAEWRGAVCVPVAWDNQVIGVLEARFPPAVSGPSEDELAFYGALADQAAVAFTNVRLTARTGEGAASQERTRLAHDLHDSVSQGLFSLTMHARAAQLAMIDVVDSEHPLARALDQLVGLTNIAASEMRSLVFELKPGRLAEQGLVEAVRQHAALLAARDEIAVSISGPDERLRLDPTVEEHLYRIITEALHNVVKHAGVAAASVSIAEAADTEHDTAGAGLRIVVADAGNGFDIGTPLPGHMGMSTMAQRADEIGATLVVDSRPGSGTTVEVWLPRASDDDVTSLDSRR